MVVGSFGGVEERACGGGIARSVLTPTHSSPAGERQLGVIIGTHGNAAAHSNVHWRSPPLACLSRLPFLVVMLPHTLEVHQLGRERAGAGATASRSRLLQSLPFPHALCAADGGDILYFASAESVYALLPPPVSPASSVSSMPFSPNAASGTTPSNAPASSMPAPSIDEGVEGDEHQGAAAWRD